MQYSIVDFSEMVGDFRLDAQAYKQEYLDIEAKVQRTTHAALGDIVSLFAKGIFDIKAGVYTDFGIPFIRISNLKDMTIDESRLVYIPEEENAMNEKTFLQRGDVVLAKTAYPAASLVTLENCNVSQDTIAVKLKKDSDVSSEYLVVFLNTRYGFLQMERWFTGNIQMHLNLTDGRRILVPILSGKLQEQVKYLFDSSIEMRKQAKATYQQAETHLLAEIGLRDWQPCHHFTFEATFAESQAAARFDAEYFRPRYQFAMTAMRRSGKTVKDFVTLTKRRFGPEYGQDFNYIEIAGVSGNGYAHSKVVAGSKAPSRAQWIVKRDDIVTSTVRPIRSLTALIEPEQDGYVCSSGFAVLKSNGIEPELLLVYLKLPIVCEILDLHTTASMYPAISTRDLLAIPVTLPDSQMMKQKIINLVRNSRLTHHNSKRLLDLAKTTVERAIEEDDAAAAGWLRAEVQKLDIDVDI